MFGRKKSDDSPQLNGITKLVRAGTVKLLPSQIGGCEPRTAGPLPYTSDPVQLVWSDIRLLFSVIHLLPVLFYPLSRDPGDETSPELGNFVQLFWQVALTIYQVLFICSLPFCLVLPVGWAIVYVAVAVTACVPIWWIVNGFKHEVHSNKNIASEDSHPDEYWLFINGVAVGRYWLQANLDRLAKVFDRPVTGIHNKTNGLIFDLAQCMIERNFNYSTQDIRDAYKLVKEALMQEQRKKVVLILHSQGGLQGSLLIDWLLAELPEDILRKLEVYTFGNAANHFNNPHKTYSDLKLDQSRDGGQRGQDKAIRYIEHYANDGDMVANWGVLHFTHVPNRFMGRLFKREGSGHLLNQHYLNYMFPLGPDGRASDWSDFMETDVDLDHDDLDRDREGLEASLCDYLSDSEPEDEKAVVDDINSPVEPVMSFHSSGSSRRPMPENPKVKDFSRLWHYRNGRSPKD